MRPVNLLPPELRPRERRREGRGPAHVVIGVLGALLVLVVVYALSLNQVNSRKTDIARAKSDIEAAKAQVAASDAFGDFHSVKETREASVKQLASDRFDWERLMRELALVLPDKTWLLDATASTTPDATGTGGATGAATPPPSTGSTASTGAAGAAPAAAASNPTLDLKGCAVRQNDVAVMLVRLRKMNRVDSVDLKDSTQETTDSGSSQSDGGSASDSENCGHGRFKFEVNVTFTAKAANEKPAGGKVPAKLGGGS
jgi:Tfp pilus assembly protein PilN